MRFLLFPRKPDGWRRRSGSGTGQADQFGQHVLRGHEAEDGALPAGHRGQVAALGTQGGESGAGAA